MTNDKSTNKGLSNPIKWDGRYVFYISGTEHDDDTVRIIPDGREALLTLVLPTLCITYADMQFANDIGGVQMEYPDSAPYGQQHFDPPVEITDEKEIEKFTWIRGAERVSIGPEEAIIQWRGWRNLIIPKLRIKANEKVMAVMRVPEVAITVSQPFITDIMQYVDGRNVGGVQLTKRHPDWKPEPVPEEYELWIRVIDGHSRSSVPKAKVSLFTWQSPENSDTETFLLEAHWYTDDIGIVNHSGLPCSEKKLVTIECESWQTRTWRFMPLPGQQVKQAFKLWQTSQLSCAYEWRVQDTLEAIATLTDSRQISILRMNHMRNANEMKPGSVIEIPYIEPVYHVETRDTLGHLAEYFCYNSGDELATVNELHRSNKLYVDQELYLHGWRFFKPVSDTLFEKLDEQFAIPRGWSRPAQRTLHDDPTRIYEHEIVAVPTQDFIRGHKLRRLY